MTFDVLLSTFLEQFKSSRHKNTLEIVLNKYLTKIKAKSLSDYFTSPGVLNIAVIRRDLTEYICSLRSSPAKREALEGIFKFWVFLHSSDQIPLNSLEGMDREVPESEEARRLKLIKSIQAEPRTIEKLEQLLWVSERTLQSDLRSFTKGSNLYLRNSQGVYWWDFRS